jgi:phosphoglycerate dehydrogenase-like enzyme
VSAWAVNAIPTAQLVLSQILLTCRGYFRGVRRYAELRDPAAARAFPRTGAEGATIGLIGMGWIARRLTEHLHAFGFNVIAYDPFLSVERARELGVEKVELADLFARAAIVSNHVPDLPRRAACWAAPSSSACARARPSSTAAAARRWSKRSSRACWPRART